MPGRKVTKAAYKELSTFGEEVIFETYLEIRDVARLLKKLEPEIGSISIGLFYRWLHSDKTGGRWQRWQDNKKIIGSSLVEEGLEIVDDADDGSVQAARLKAEQRRWMAERYNKSEFGKPDATVNVVNVGTGWLDGLKQLEKEISKPEEIVIEAEIIESDDD